MKAMVLQTGRRETCVADAEKPTPRADQVLIQVAACGVCRTDLHVVDGELPNPKLPLIPGHEIVGRVDGLWERRQTICVGQQSRRSVAGPYLRHL